MMAALLILALWFSGYGCLEGIPDNVLFSTFFHLCLNEHRSCSCASRITNCLNVLKMRFNRDIPNDPVEHHYHEELK